ncbi:hypothetical protein RH858_11270 [Halalkaliarchaeum sp. AArc-GB]|nr:MULTISPECIES: hypothetical protein [unclassified Halalkaliarchaeum]MDR5673721.1 hypothetical protein [Halalkaliarchaeum sp. AArc-GB]
MTIERADGTTRTKQTIATECVATTSERARIRERLASDPPTVHRSGGEDG